jgi:hypothetical protein
MNKPLLTFLFTAILVSTYSQTQIGNSDFESWETVASGEEPLNWNSFLTATGSLSWAASDQLQSSTDIRPGSAGTKSAKIFSNSTLSVVANGNLTVGQINMNSASPANSNNYNSSITANTNFSEALTGSPDSLVFWAKFIPANASGTDSAGVSAIIHDNYDLRDPLDANSQTHIVAVAATNYASTNGNWVRISVPFNYSGPASSPEFILLTFTTNRTPGGGSDNDQVWIDDVELIYNTPAGIEEQTSSTLSARIKNHELIIQSSVGTEGNVAIYNAAGQLVHSGSLTDPYTFCETGLFVVRFVTNHGILTQKLMHY